MIGPGGTFKRATVTIDDVSPDKSWERELWHLAAQRGQPAPNIPPSNEPTNQHGEAS